jgi:hypothetical protein
MDVPNHSMEPDIFEKESKRDFAKDEISNEKVLRSTKLRCSICKIGDLRPYGKPTQMIVYGRDGVEILPHQYMRCNYRAGTGDII